jgi:hypothetical protein
MWTVTAKPAAAFSATKSFSRDRPAAGTRGGCPSTPRSTPERRAHLPEQMLARLLDRGQRVAGLTGVGVQQLQRNTGLDVDQRDVVASISCSSLAIAKRSSTARRRWASCCAAARWPPGPAATATPPRPPPRPPATPARAAAPTTTSDPGCSGHVQQLHRGEPDGGDRVRRWAGSWSAHRTVVHQDIQPASVVTDRLDQPRRAPGVLQVEGQDVGPGARLLDRGGDLRGGLPVVLVRRRDACTLTSERHRSGRPDVGRSAGDEHGSAVQSQVRSRLLTDVAQPGPARQVVEPAGRAGPGRAGSASSPSALMRRVPVSDQRGEVR